MKTHRSIPTAALPKTTTWSLRTVCFVRLLSLLMLLAASAAQAQLTYINNNGAITITGYSGGGAVVIPNTINGYPVTSIGTEAFYGSSLTSVTIPNSVTNIGEFAFAYCSSMTAINVNPGSQTFTNVGGVLFNKNLTTLVQYPGGLGGNYVIPSTVGYIGGGAFGWCNTNLISVTIPNSVTNIGDSAFTWCISLTNVTIPGSVTGIGDDAFQGCYNVASMTIPSSVTNLGDAVFSECSLSAINVNSNNPAYSSVAGVLFNKAQTTLIDYPTANGLTNYAIPYGVISIADYAFENAFLKNLTIPNSVTNIEEDAFYDIFLPNLVIPNTVTSIGAAAFAYSSLTNITIGSGVTFVGNGMFYDCTSLKAVYFEGNAPSSDSSEFSGDSELAAVYYLPGTTGWESTFDGIPVFEVGGIYKITVSASPSAGGTVSGGGTFVPDSLQTVTATANSGYTFTNWTENGRVVSTSASYTFTVNSNANLVANFITLVGGVLYQTLDDPLAWSTSGGGTYAQGISGSNIVGYYFDTNTVYHGFVYNGTTYTTLDDPNAAGSYQLSDISYSGGTYATGISGTNIVGYYTDVNGYTHGFLYNGSTYTTLDDPNAGGPYSEFYYDVTGGTWAQGIEGGNIVGYYTDSHGNVHGFLYNGTNYTTLDDPNVVYAANGGWGTHVLGISQGNIVGYLDITGVPYGTTQGMLFNGSGYNVFYGTSANGISGDNIVGNSGNSGYVAFGNFVIMDGIPYFTGNYSALNVPNEVATSPNGISGNNIVGTYTDANDVSHGFTALAINYSITLSISPGSAGTVSGDGTFASGSSQTVMATANNGYTFTNWTENGIVVSSLANYTFMVSSNVNLVANFTGVGSSYQTINEPLAESNIGNGTYALGISGTNIVGSYESNYVNGFLLNGSIYTTLSVPNPNFPFTIATGISGTNIVGWYTAGAEAHGFLYKNGNFTTLDDPNASAVDYPTFLPDGGYENLLVDSQFDGWGGTFASGISGTNIVGWYVDTNGYTHGFLYNGSTYTTLDDPHGVGATYAQGIDGKNIVGWYLDTNGYTHGFLYNGSTYTTLDEPNGVGSTYAQGISGSNIVGYYTQDNGYSGHGFVYNGSTYTSFDDPNGVGATAAQGVSSNTVVGWYFDSLGNIHGFATTLENLQTVTYTATPTYGVAPLTVQFTSSSVDSGGNSITRWNWNFGDGSTSTAQDPSHVYTNVGTFQPSLITTNSLGAAVYGYGPSITVLTPAPSVTIQPTNNPILVASGSNVTLSASVTGTGPFSFQWQMNGTNLPNGIITTVAGRGSVYPGDGGVATNAELNYPTGVAVDNAGNVFIADQYNNRIRKVATNGIITTVAGNGYGAGTYTGAYSGDGGTATNAELNLPQGVAVDTTGNLFIVDTGNQRIRKVGTNGIITTVAGNGFVTTNSYGYVLGGYSGDGGAATNAELNYPYGVAVDNAGNLFIADLDNYRIRKVGANGIITTLAGNGTGIYSGDGGEATNAGFAPNDVAVDAAGNLFIADANDNRIRKVSANGIITTVAGNGAGAGTGGYGSYYSGDGGAATNAELYYPQGMAVDATGNLFIADFYNTRIRKVATNGIITTVAGNGTNGYAGDGGTATNAELYYPIDVAEDVGGNLFIDDSFNNCVRKVTVQGQTLVLNNVGASNAGAYDVVVSSPYGSVTSSVVNLTITLPNTVQYSASPTNGTVPLTVQFTSPGVDSGGNTITHWNWNFGDGSTGIAQNPSHVYTSAGTFQPSLITTNNLGVTVPGSGPSVTANVAPVYSGLVLNGGFETGDFTGWTSSGNFTDTFVITGSQYAHSGIFGAELGPVGSLGFISQTLVTTPGTTYLLSLWLDSHDGETNNEFLVSWNGTTLFDQKNLGAIGWTNLQFYVNATNASSVLQFGFQDDPSYLGLDDISVISMTPLWISSVGLSTNGGFQLSVHGQIGQAYTLQASTNLVNWVSITDFTCTNSPMYVVDPQAKNYSRRFYRLAQATLLIPASPIVLGFGLAQPLTKNGLALMLQGPVGSNYVIQASTDLLTWLPITNFVSTNSPFYFSDPQATNYSRRFYRAVIP